MSKLSVADGLSIGISLCALAISTALAFLQYWPSYETRAMVSYANVSIGDGSYGRGARLTAVMNFINAGNRPIILTRVLASFGSSADGTVPSNCELSNGNWAGMPWSYSEAHGEAMSEALPRVIPPGLATAGVTWFEPLPVAAETVGQQQKRFICIVYEVLDPYGRAVQKRAPIGVVQFDGAQVTDIAFDDEYRAPVLISE
ncbi:hypothetical protein ACTTAL_07055 [Rhodobacter capsulatus]|uniref:hypothetical protein n=1 Tax=Rhodobacter capsulatus TaxID=1061 RepID=UPI00103FD686|nr:hypothetical protein [Rhodobacter capsulatus]